LGEWQLRRSLAGLAAGAGLGEVRRVHHERRPELVLVIAKLGLDWVTVLFLIEALSRLHFDPGIRPVAVLIWLVVVHQPPVQRRPHLLRRQQLMPDVCADAVSGGGRQRFTGDPLR
jgi:hypothetical protein